MAMPAPDRRAPDVTIRHAVNLFPIGNFFRQRRFGWGVDFTGPGRMTQIFSPSADTWLRLFLVGGLAALGGGLAVCDRVRPLGFLHRRQHSSAGAAGAVQP